MQKTQRGSYDSAQDNKNEITMVRWNDNNIVTIATNYGSVHPLHKAKRFSRKERKSIHVNQPDILMDYNKHMGGVDIHDNGVANYRIQIRGKKWWWPLFTNSLDSCMVNSWKLFNLLTPDKSMSQLDYKSYIARCLIRCESPEDVEYSGGSSRSSTVLDKIRYDGVGHIVVKSDNETRRRCKLCHSTTVYQCKKCNCYLHSKCFEEYHLKK